MRPSINIPRDLEEAAEERDLYILNLWHEGDEVTAAVLARARERRARNAWMRQGKYADFVFPSPRSDAGHVTELRGAFHGALKHAGLEDIGLTIHDLRATAITMLLLPKDRGGAGLDVSKVKALIGSKDGALIDKVYNRMVEDKTLEEAAAEIDASGTWRSR